MPKIATDVIEQTKTQSLWFVTPKFISQGQLTITYTDLRNYTKIHLIIFIIIYSSPG